MSLDYNYSKCDDTLTDEHFARTCELVVFHTVFVGMPEITRENFSEFAMRCAMYDLASAWPGTRSIAEWAEIVHPWIGLRTNASHKTRAAFWKMIANEAAVVLFSIDYAAAEKGVI